MTKKETNDVLTVLTAAALLLPGIASQHADAESPPENVEISFRHSEYSEQQQPASYVNGNLLAEPVERYDIRIDQLSLSSPIGTNKSIDIALSTETMSGASPWYIVPDGNGDPIQIMSGATIDEQRSDVNMGMSFYKEQSKIATNISYSSENDYTSIGAGIANTLWSRDNNTTLDFGFGFTKDTIEPTQALNIDRIDIDKKESVSGSLGITKILNKNTVLGMGIDLVQYSGFLSDPYKLAFVKNNFLQDSRPQEKQQVAVNVQVRQFIPLPQPAAFHADYRSYSNNWGVRSSTFKTAWIQNIGRYFQFSPQFRSYSQTAADFYQDYYLEERNDGYYSSDYRLSEYASTSIKFKASFISRIGRFHLSYEQYDSKNTGDSIKNSNPGLVDFDVISLGFDLIDI